ncbi:phenoloxidase-activating factor 2-like [Euwallacea fornicatus]|uniref:phenoloxidase-activating factor 2-like n=1 Tax=Euwallacea fornicatus TaxID=995702 RepID=UPI00338E576E
MKTKNNGLFSLQIILLVLSKANSQNQEDIQRVEDFYKTNQTVDPFSFLIEVTSPKPTDLAPLEKCGEGSDERKHRCVSYYNCDRDTNMIITEDQGNSANTNGVGLIDIRVGINKCDHYLNVCCGLPQDSNKDSGNFDPFNPGSIRPPISSTTSTTTIPPLTPSTPRPSSVQCGIRNPTGIDFTITGNNNNEAEYGEFPWIVAILRRNFIPRANESLAICGGSLIALNVVLTGAHCVVDLDTSQYMVRAGEWDTQTTNERLPHQERNVQQVIIHEGYTPQVIFNDVALLILSRPLDRADNIGTICLPKQGGSISSRNCFASGWGKDIFGKEGKYQVILKKIELPKVNFDECQQALRRTRLGASFKLHESFMCAGGEQGKDTCTGDGGSPLVCPDLNNPGRYVQSGMVAWGIGCGEQGIPGVYVDVTKFINWIDNRLSRLNIDIGSYSV